MNTLVEIEPYHTNWASLPAIKLLVEDLRFPEGPAFAPDGSLWAVELKGASLIQYTEGIVKRYEVGGAPNGIAITGDGLIWFCDAEENSVRKFDPVTNMLVTVADRLDDQPFTKPNDLVFDQNKNLLFTCPGESRREPNGYACVLMSNGTIRKFTDQKYFPNGLAFTGDGEELILAETYRHRLWRGGWDMVSGEWINPRVWCEIGGPDGPGGPDGMAFDASGNLFIAVYGTGSIRVVNPEGKVINEIPLPGDNPTNCAFDPSGKLGLIVTEAQHGKLYSIKTDQQ